MGLDQYAYVSSPEDSRNEIATWRKHPNLQGWMENLWNEKGRPGSDSEAFDGSFNCIDLELTREDLDRLEIDLVNQSVASLKTVGFFFGEDSDDYYYEQDLAFVLEAKQEILLGNKVYYTSWW